jgi:hypothetical protein
MHSKPLTVVLYYEELIEGEFHFMNEEAEVRQLINYFEDNYIGGMSRNNK